MATAVATGVTPAGTKYTVYEETNGADTVQWGVGDAYKNLDNLHATMYAHGSGGSYDQFNITTVLNGAKYGIIDIGGVWASCGGSKLSVFGGQNNWGRDIAKVAFSEACQIVASRISVIDWIPWGRSMGGIIGKYLATQDAYVAPRTIGYIDMSGIYDILGEFDDGNHFDLPSWYGTAEPPTPPARPGSSVVFDDPAWATWRSSLVAWKNDPATISARAALAAATTTNDPARYSTSVWAGKQVEVISGTKDTIATPLISSVKFWNDYHTNFGSKSALVNVTGATHSQTGGTFDSPAVLSFIKLMWGIAGPTFTAGYKIDREYMPVSQTKVYLLTPQQ